MQAQQTIICGICGKEALQARIIGVESKMCNTCADLFQKAISSKVYTLGWGANGTYLREENHEALAKWKTHMIACGWVWKRNRWVKPTVVPKETEEAKKCQT